MLNSESDSLAHAPGDSRKPRVYIAHNFHQQPPWRAGTGSLRRLVEGLRRVGVEVYDSGSAVVQEPPLGLSIQERADAIFNSNFRELESCEVCILVLPAGAGAHLEAGWCAGKGKKVFIYAPHGIERPELMYGLFRPWLEKQVRAYTSMSELLEPLFGIRYTTLSDAT